MSRVLGVIDFLGSAFARISAVLTLSIVAMILAEIVARSVFNLSLSFAWEYSAYAMGIAMFGGAAYTLRTGGHIRVSLLASHLPARAAHWVDVACTAVAVAISGYLAVALVQFAWRSFVSGSTSSTISATPLVIPQGAIAIGAILLCAQFVARLIRLFIGEDTEDRSVSFLAE